MISFCIDIFLIKKKKKSYYPKEEAKRKVDFGFLKYQGDQLFRIVISVFLEITTAALRICMYGSGTS